jgi:glycosyltransferase involved in cell wall biosynthesis
LKIGCLTLAFNQGLYLQSAIDSVVNQTNLGEYYVYNPGSTDNTSEILRKNEQNLTEIYVASDLGPSDGLNVGLHNIQSEIFYYLNADDCVLPDAFSYVSSYFKNNPDCDILYGGIEIIDTFGAVLRTLPPIKFTLKGYAYKYSVLYQQATFFRRSCTKQVKFNLDNRTCWDGEFIVDLALAGFTFHKTNKVLGQFRIYPDSITGSGRLKEQIKIDHHRIAKKILGRDLRNSEVVYGLVIGKLLALFRKLVSFKRVIARSNFVRF